MNFVNIACYIGSFFLAFICFLDFRKNIPKPKPVLPFYVALFLFIVANSVVYIGLLSLLAGIELKLMGFEFYWGGDDNVKLFKFRKISPLIIAVLYFGFGKAKLEIGNKDFTLYNSMLNIFRSMFPKSLGVSKKLNDYIDKLGDETEKLKQTIGNFHEIASNYKWNIFEDEWKEIANSHVLIEGDIEFLTKVESSLSNLNKDDINNTKKDIVKQIEKSRVEINEKLRKYIKKIISKNIVHERSIEEILVLIDVKRTEDLIVKKRSNYIARAFGISFLCGILLSAVYTFTDSRYTPTECILYFVASFFFFLAIFSFINKMAYSIEGFSISLVIGAAGGFCGHLAFLLVSNKIRLADANLLSIGYYFSLITMTVQGIVLGTVAAFVAFIFKHKINPKIEHPVLKYLLISITGGVAFLLVAFLFSEISIDLPIDYRDFLKPILTGCIALMGISFVSGIFDKEIKSVE